MTRRARRAVDVRREEILSATVGLIDREGLAAVRVADVAAELGVSPSLVFYHFGTKDDLVAESFAHAVERDLGRIDRALASDDPVEQLRRLVRLYGPTGQAAGWRVARPGSRGPEAPEPGFPRQNSQGHPMEGLQVAKKKAADARGAPTACRVKTNTLLTSGRTPLPGENLSALRVLGDPSRLAHHPRKLPDGHMPVKATPVPRASAPGPAG